MSATPPVPPFRDLLDADAPPFPPRVPPADARPPDRPSLLARWNRLPAAVQGVIVGGLALAVAVGVLLVPEAASKEYVASPEPAAPPPELKSITQLQPVPQPVEAPLPSWYMTAADVPLNTRMTADMVKRLLRTQPGKPLPPNAITDANTILGKYAVRALAANATITPADFADAPIPQRVLEWLEGTTLSGKTLIPFEVLPDGSLRRVYDIEPIVKQSLAPLPSVLKPRAPDVVRGRVVSFEEFPDGSRRRLEDADPPVPQKPQPVGVPYGTR